MMLIPGYDAKAAPRDPYCIKCRSYPRCKCGDETAGRAIAVIRTALCAAAFLVLVLGSIIVVEIFG